MILALSLVALAPLSSPGDEHWIGAVDAAERSATVRLCLSDEGAWVDLPEFGYHDLRATRGRGEEALHVSFSVYGAAARLVLREEDGTLAGEWTGAGAPGTIELRRVGPCRRAYTAEGLRFENDGVRLAGTLLLPAGDGPFPAVVWTHGSGAVGRDDPIYRGLAVMLVEHGIAALIYDKRGVGESTGSHRGDPFDALTMDAVAGVARLRERADIDATRIGVGGLSQGGWLAPYAAARSDAVRFVVALSAPGISPGEQNVFNQYNKVLAAGHMKEDAEEASRILHLAHAYFRTGEGRAEVLRELEDARWQPWYAAAYELELLESGLPQAPVDMSTLDFDPARIWPRVRVPAIAIWGELDVLVPASVSVDVVRRALDAAGNEKRELIVLPATDHTLRLAPEAPWTWGRIHPTCSTIADFIEALDG